MSYNVDLTPGGDLIFQPIPRPFLLNSRLFLGLSSYRPDFWSVYLGACSLQCLSFFSGPKFQVCFATQFPFSFLPLPITTLEFRWVSLGLAQLLFGLIRYTFSFGFYFSRYFYMQKAHYLLCFIEGCVIRKQVNHHPYSTSFLVLVGFSFTFYHKSRVRWAPGS